MTLKLVGAAGVPVALVVVAVMPAVGVTWLPLDTGMLAGSGGLLTKNATIQPPPRN